MELYKAARLAFKDHSAEKFTAFEEQAKTSPASNTASRVESHFGEFTKIVLDAFRVNLLPTEAIPTNNSFERQIQKGKSSQPYTFSFRNECFFQFAANNQNLGAHFVSMDIPYLQTNQENDQYSFVMPEALSHSTSVGNQDKSLCQHVLVAFNRITSPNAFGLIFCSFKQAAIFSDLLTPPANENEAFPWGSITQFSQLFFSKGSFKGPPARRDANQLAKNIVETAILIRKGNADWASFTPFENENDFDQKEKDKMYQKTNLPNLFLPGLDFFKWPAANSTDFPFRKPVDLMEKFLKAYSKSNHIVVEAFSGNRLISF